MELAFAERELREQCLNELKAVQKLGLRAAGKLKQRLADIAAASAVSDLLGFAGNLRQHHDHQTQIVVDLTDGWQLFFASGHVESRTLDNGEIDWARTRRIKILRLEKQS